MFQIAILRLFDSVWDFHDGTRERHDRNISWANFQAIFQRYFRDVKTDHYHFTQLQTARQRKGEILQEFEDRCRNLAQLTVLQAEDPVLQRVYYETGEAYVTSQLYLRFIGYTWQAIVVSNAYQFGRNPQHCDHGRAGWGARKTERSFFTSGGSTETQHRWKAPTLIE